MHGFGERRLGILIGQIKGAPNAEWRRRAAVRLCLPGPRRRRNRSLGFRSGQQDLGLSTFTPTEDSEYGGPELYIESHCRKQER